MNNMLKDTAVSVMDNTCYLYDYYRFQQNCDTEVKEGHRYKAREEDNHIQVSQVTTSCHKISHLYFCSREKG
jgi:hypothetical protein